MGSLLTYSGVVTKLRAMSAGLLQPVNYEDIAALPSVPDIVNYLQQNGFYTAVLDDLDNSMLHRGDIEKILEAQLYLDYVKIYRFCDLKQRELLKDYVKRQEIDMINYCLRLVINRSPVPFDLEYKKEFFDKYTNISIDAMMAAKTTDELIESLKSTEYYAPLHRITSQQTVTLFDYDLALNQYYFSNVWNSRKKILNKKEREAYIRERGTQIDLLNLQWIYRAKHFFHMEPSDIYALLVPIHYKVSVDQIKALIEAQNHEEYNNVMNKISYSKKYDFSQKLTVNRMYRELLFQLYKQAAKQDPYSIASITTYLFMREEELRRLTTAIECVRYGLPVDETLSYVGGKVE